MDLTDYLQEWDLVYQDKIKEINLFQQSLTQNWSSDRIKYFASVFYHVRGHFQDFLWYIGNHASDKETKDIILENISEELNGSARSHEEMYLLFANSIGCDVRNEFVFNDHYLPSIKEFNHGHINWLHQHSCEERFAALSAYERLDNIDYINLLTLVKSLNVPSKGQVFFKVHTAVTHFESTEKKLKKIWEQNPDLVNNSFTFIADHQLAMWKELSSIVSEVN